MDFMKDDVVWDIIGDKLIRGKSAVEKAMKEMNDKNVQQLTIHNIITHGNSGSVNGTLILKDEQKFAFCDVYKFAGFGKNSKINAITTYVIKTS